MTVIDAQEAEIEVRALVEPGGTLTASVIAGRRQDVQQDFVTVEQTSTSTGPLTATARLSLD